MTFNDEWITINTSTSENVPVGAESSAPPSQAHVSQLLQPSRVQPSRTNKASKMAEVLASIEEDDDGTTRVPGRRKRRVEDGPEELSTVPEGVECNPMAPTKRRKKDQVQPSRAPPLLSLQPAHPAQIPPRPDPRPQPQLNTFTQSVPLPTVSQTHSSQSAPQRQPQPHQTPAPRSSAPHHLQRHDEDSVAAFDIQAGLNNGWNNDSMLALGDEDANMVNTKDMDNRDEKFSQESQLQSDDMYATPPPPGRRLRRKYVHGDSESDDQLQQPESPQLRPEGCITYFLIDFLLMCLSIDIDEVSPSEDKDAAQRALHGQHVNQQNGV